MKARLLLKTRGGTPVVRCGMTLSATTPAPRSSTRTLNNACRNIYMNTTGGSKTLLLHSPHGSTNSWTKVKEVLLETDLEAVFTYTLWPLEEDEEYEIKYVTLHP